MVRNPGSLFHQNRYCESVIVQFPSWDSVGEEDTVSSITSQPAFFATILYISA
ncbi:MAG: hypothetical protein V7K67_01725 [Nostoc sp.]|uniref:hypothetical protein n=1 Tax=Nostoc sp. TaxID=1180 RepID=UPI002FF29D87